MKTKSIRKIRPTKVRSVRKTPSRSRKVKIGGKSRSGFISRIRSFKPRSLVSIGGKRKYRKHKKPTSKKSYRKIKSTKRSVGGKSKRGRPRNKRRSKSRRT